MSEERETKMNNDMVPKLSNDITLQIKQLIIKSEYTDTNVIHIRGKLISTLEIGNHIVIALHAKNKMGNYIHLQQYEFEYTLDQTLEKNIDISALILSELSENEVYELEIKLLTEQSKQQWQIVQHYNVQVKQ